MTTIGNLKLYDIFRKDLHLPDNRAIEAVTALDDFFDKKSSGKIALLATKDELVTTRNELRNELVATKNELKQEIHSVATRLDLMATKAELSAVRLELKNDIHEVKSELSSAIHKTEAKLAKDIYNSGLYQALLIIIAVFTILKFAGVLK